MTIDNDNDMMLKSKDWSSDSCFVCK